MLSLFQTLTDKINAIVTKGAKSSMSNLEFLEREILKWKGSPERLMQIKGELYYQNDHDILKRKRTMIGENGKLEVVENLPNNLIVDNRYAILVNQKTNYLLGKPITLKSKNQTYIDELSPIFDKKFMKTLKNAGKAALKQGLSWLHFCYSEEGEVRFRVFQGYEILPFWKDEEKEILDFAVRLYEVEGYEGTVPVKMEKVEVYDLKGVHKYVLEGNKLIPDVEHGDPDQSFVLQNKESLNWSKIPLIPIRYNVEEIPLLRKVKSLQDGINVMLSDFTNNMQEDARNTILVIKNYDGVNLAEFRKNLSTYGAVKVRYDGETKGGVETLEIKVNAENYKAIIEIFKKAMIENGMGYDAKDDRLSGNPNQMNIQSMYSDIDLDANDTEMELQAAFTDILWFVNMHLSNLGLGDFTKEKVEVIFNRDILISESEVIDNCQKSIGILSDETIAANHPWNDDPAAELERLKKQKEEQQKEAEQYNPFGDQGGEPVDEK